MHKIDFQPFFRRKLIQLYVWLLVGAAIGVGVLEYFYPAHTYLHWFPVIPVFFGVKGVVFIKALSWNALYGEKNLLNVYLLMKVIKMICLIALAVAYLLFLEETRYHFIVALAAFFLLHLVWETSFFFGYERILKQEKSNNESTDS